jgi:hypothetical protein
MQNIIPDCIHTVAKTLHCGRISLLEQYMCSKFYFLELHFIWLSTCQSASARPCVQTVSSIGYPYPHYAQPCTVMDTKIVTSPQRENQ